MEHDLDNYQYCRKCGLLTVGLTADSCAPLTEGSDVLLLVNRRLASIVTTNAIERDVQWAIKSLSDDALRSIRAFNAFRRLHPPIYDDDENAA